MSNRDGSPSLSYQNSQWLFLVNIKEVELEMEVVQMDDVIYFRSFDNCICDATFLHCQNMNNFNIGKYD